MESVEPSRVTHLTFVYAAGHGPLAALADTLKKLAGKGCPLCAVTHGLTGKRPQFERFENSVGVPVALLHEDEVAADPKLSGLDLPCIIATVDNNPDPILVMGPRAIAELQASKADLEKTLRLRLTSLGFELPSREG